MSHETVKPALVLIVFSLVAGFEATLNLIILFLCELNLYFKHCSSACVGFKLTLIVLHFRLMNWRKAT
jgi:hypothetical protein